MERTQVKIFTILFFSILISSVAFSEKSTEKSAVQLALNWKAEPEFGGFYAAQVDKIYEKNKIFVNIIQGGAGTPTVQMLASGQVEFATVSGDEIILARNNGADVVALYAVFQTAPYAFMLREESPISSIKDLFASDSTVAVVKGLPYVAFLEKKYGFKKIKTVPYAGGITNFLADKKFVQQCFISSEPLLAAQAGVKTKTFLIADSGFNPYTVVLATNGKTLREKPELVKAMVKSVREGWQSYIKNPEPAHQVIAKLNSSMNVANMAEMHKREMPLIVSSETEKNGLGFMSELRWQELAQQLKSLKLTKKLVPAKELFVNY